jgi:hypothetical protein
VFSWHVFKMTVDFPEPATAWIVTLGYSGERMSLMMARCSSEGG